MDFTRIKEFQHDIRILAAELAKSAGKKGTHVGGGFSSLEIISVLYGGIMRYNAENPYWENRDRFIPSKAHCVLVQWPALYKAGFIKKEDINTAYIDGGKLCGRPYNPEFGTEFCGGSLGMGLSLGIGKALYAKRYGLSFNTYVLLGDGECNEGSVWEGFLAAPQFKLDNLVAIIDYNNMQFDGVADDIMTLRPLKDKLVAFGWCTVEVDGHNIEELFDAFCTQHPGKPLAIVANTIKAHGVPSLENKAESHHAELSEEDYQYILNYQD